MDLIPHGIPDIPLADSNVHKKQFGVAEKQVVLTFGLLSPNKGIEHVLNALPKVVENFPNVVYIILGATHPNLVRDQGEAYRLSLERLVNQHGLKNHVIFFDRFVEAEELSTFIGAADMYFTPLSQRGADHERCARLWLWRRKSCHIHPLLACGRTLGRFPWRPRAFQRYRCHRPRH